MLEIDLSTIPPEGKQIDAGLDAAILGIEREADFRLEDGGSVSCRVNRGDDGLVQLVGRLTARLELTCGRCLEAFRHDVSQGLELVYVPRGSVANQADEDEVSLADRDMIVAYYDGERLDLAEMVREQLVLGLSMKRLCREDCRGLCAACGANRNLGECGCPPDQTDSPLAPLGDILDNEGLSGPEGSASRTRVRT
jgi:uncharacterized metal-binding protein YceD (DUF177 family)